MHWNGVAFLSTKVLEKMKNLDLTDSQNAKSCIANTQRNWSLLGKLITRLTVVRSWKPNAKSGMKKKSLLYTTTARVTN